MPVLVRRRAPGSPTLAAAQLRRALEIMLDELQLPNSELSVLLTDDTAIHAINLEHRAKDKPTDVLSFPQNEFSAPERPRRGANLGLLGDIVVSLDTAARQAKGRKRPLFEEVRFLVAHGLLHLLGYDHMTPNEKRIMSARTRWLVRRVELRMRIAQAPMSAPAKRRATKPAKRRATSPAKRRATNPAKRRDP